jgi:hypothetical protein
MLTSYGDMDASRLTEKPAGRQPIDTRTLPLERIGEVVAAVARALDGGAKVYWVCPLVAESEVSDLAAAEARYDALKERFGARAGLVHGRMKGPDKDRAMSDFAEGAVDLLVATTVIEVGVDVPRASVMVIEHAERFGLAQLHLDLPAALSSAVRRNRSGAPQDPARDRRRLPYRRGGPQATRRRRAARHAAERAAGVSIGGPWGAWRFAGRGAGRRPAGPRP